MQRQNEKKEANKSYSFNLNKIFPYLSAFDLIKIKSVSHTFKLLSEDYISQTENQIYFAASSDCLVEVGNENIKGAKVETNLHPSISSTKLISAFKSPLNKSMDLFKTEADALNTLFPSDAVSLDQRLYSTAWVDDLYRKLKIQVVPIYKVQLVHANITYSTITEKQLISVAEFKKQDKTWRTGCHVATTNLIPLTVSVKFRFFKGDSMKMLVDNRDLHKSEAENRKKVSHKKCIVM